MAWLAVLTTLLLRTDAYYGKNTKIADTLNNLLLKSPQNWQTTVGLPFFRIESTVVEWDVRICAISNPRPLHTAPVAVT